MAAIRSKFNVYSDFYVYIYFRLDGSPCYVGKGYRERWISHKRKSCNKHLAAIIKNSGGDLPVVKIRQGLTEVQANEIEVALIKAIGRKANGGPLVNQTDGGEGARGRKMPAEEIERRKAILNRPDIKAKMVASHKGQPSGRKGKKVSPETLAKIIVALKDRGPHTEETKLKMSISQTERWACDPFRREKQRQIQLERYSDPEERRRTGAAIAAAFAKPENEGKNRIGSLARWSDPAQKEKLRGEMLERYSDPEERKKQSERMKLWWAERKIAMEAESASS